MTDDRRHLNATKLRAGFNIFFEDDTGEDRPQEEIDEMLAAIQAIAEGHGFNIESVGDMHSAVLFFGKMYLDEIMYNIQNGDVGAQRTHVAVQEAIEELEGMVDPISKEKLNLLRGILA